MRACSHRFITAAMCCKTPTPGRCPRCVVPRCPADARVLEAGTGRPSAGHTPDDDYALRPAHFRVSDSHGGDRSPLRNAAYHRSVIGDSCTLEVGLIALTTPVFRSSSTSKPPRPSTFEPDVEASGIHSLRGDSAGVSSTAIELFWFYGSSPQRPPGYGFSGFSPQEPRGARDPLSYRMIPIT